MSKTFPNTMYWCVFSADAGWDEYYLHSVHARKETADEMVELLSGIVDEFGGVSSAYVSRVPFYE